MTTTLRDWFFMRDDFDTFSLEPEKHRRFVFGVRDRKQRDDLLEGLEEGTIGNEGHKAVVYGDFGRGKTHQSLNLVHEIERRNLPINPVYVKCTEYGAKEPFGTLFRQMLEAMGAVRLNQLAHAYEQLIKDGKVQDFATITGSDLLDKGFRALASPNEEIPPIALRWLGGTKLPKDALGRIGSAIPANLGVSRDFAAVARTVVHMSRAVDSKLPVFFIDEAERLGQITHSDTYTSWFASLRALTEIVDLGLIFFVGAKTRDALPELLVLDEVATRIGIANYRDLLDPSRDDLREWILELFQTFIRKGPVPAELKDAVGASANDIDVPERLRELVGSDPAALEAFPFVPETMDLFLSQSVADELANRPREVLKRIQRSATRAARIGKHRIDTEILEATRGEGY